MLTRLTAQSAERKWRSALDPLAPGNASRLLRSYSSVSGSPSFSPSTEMRSERRKCRSFCVKGSPSTPVSPAASPSFARFDHFVEANGGFKHQQHIESVLANVLHNSGDLFALNDRLVDGLAQLLNQFAQTRCHGYLQERPHETSAERRRAVPPILRFCARQIGNAAESSSISPRVAATIINGMRPVTIGRALGISVRLVGRAAIRTLEGPAQPARQSRGGQFAGRCPGPAHRARGPLAA